MSGRKEREQRRTQRIQPTAGSGLLTRRNFAIGGIAAAAAGALAWSRCETRPTTAPQTPTTPPKEKPREPMPYYTQEEFNQVVITTVKKYNDVIGLSASAEEAIKAIQLTPPFSSISKEEKQKWCDISLHRSSRIYTRHTRWAPHFCNQ